MDYQKKSTPIIYSKTQLIQHPAYLWIGKKEALTHLVINTLQQFFCPSSCKTCSICLAIQQKQHHSLLWLCPEKQYTREQLEPLFKVTSFALDPNEHFFIVLEKADFLNQSSANNLLKILEEPPQGYHFILLAERTEYILPTVQSRCINHVYNLSENTDYNEFLSYFISKSSDPIAFTAMLEQANLTDRDSLELLDKLYSYWLKQKVSSESSKKTSVILELLKNAIEKPPMPGSSKLFWKNLYLLFFFYH
ncbi:MAG: hypothetical protein WDZ41_00380 [Candidatus Babeliales bacterium]